MVEAESWRQEQAAALAVSAAWHAEAFARTKGRLPSLKDLLKRRRRRVGSSDGGPSRQAREEVADTLRSFFACQAPGVVVSERIPIVRAGA